MNQTWLYIFIGLSIADYYLFYKITKDVLNPVGVMNFIWLFMAGVCHLGLGEYQREWIGETYLVVLTSSLVMTLTGLFILRKNRARQVSKKKKHKIISMNASQRKTFHKLFLALFVLCFVSAIGGMIENGINLTYFFTNVTEGNKGEWILSSNVFIEYFSNMLPHCAILAFFEICFFDELSKRAKRFNWFIIGSSLFYVLFVMCSRGTAMIMLLGMVYIYHRRNRLTIRKIAFFAVIILLAFGAFSLMRWRVHDSNLAIYSGKSDSLIFNSIYNYIVYCYQNLDTLIRNGSPMTLYKYELQPIAKMIGTLHEGDLAYISVSGFNACTFLIGPYHDLGMFGVVIYSFIDMAIVAFFYNISNKDESYSIIVAMLQRGVISCFFSEYILLLNGQSLPLVLACVLIWMSKKFVFIRDR